MALKRDPSPPPPTHCLVRFWAGGRRRRRRRRRPMSVTFFLSNNGIHCLSPLYRLACPVTGPGWRRTGQGRIGACWPLGRSCLAGWDVSRTGPLLFEIDFFVFGVVVAVAVAVVVYRVDPCLRRGNRGSIDSLGPFILVGPVPRTHQGTGSAVHVTLRVERLVHKLSPVGLDAAFGQGWGEIHDRVVQSLHLDQEAFETLEGHPTRIGPQFDQSFGVGGVGKMAHAHFDGKFLEFAPSFDHGARGRQAGHQGVMVPNGPHDQAGGHQEQRQSIEQRVVKLVLVQDFSMTPPLFVVKGIQGIHALQEFGFELGAVHIGGVQQGHLGRGGGRHGLLFSSQGENRDELLCTLGRPPSL